MARQITYGLFVDWNNNGWFYDVAEDLSNLLLNAEGDESISNPDESFSASKGYTSAAAFTIANQNQVYSPSNSSSPIYASISNGGYYQKKVLFQVTIAGTTHTVFSGIIKSLTESGRTAKTAGVVILNCVGKEDAFINMRLVSPVATTQVFYENGKDEGQLIAKTLELCGLTDGTDFVSQDYSGGTKTIDRGLFTIPWYWLDSESPIEDCWRLAAACGGRFYFDTETGKFYYKNAEFYGFGVSGTSQFTADESNCASISPVYGDKELYESVKVVARPRQIGDSEVVWEPETIPTIFPGETLNITAKISTPIFRYNGYTLRAMSTGGFDKTGEVAVSATYNSQEVRFIITNNSGFFLFLRNFKVTANPIDGGQTVEYTESSTDSFWTTRNGKQRQISDNPYIQTFAHAKAIGKMLFHRQSVWRDQIRIDGFRGNAFGRVGMLITVSNATIGISKTAIIVKQQWKLGRGQFDQSFDCYAYGDIYGEAVGDYFVIGTHSSNSTKRYFY